MLSFRKLLKQRLRRIELERESWFADCYGRGLLTHLFSLEIAFKRIKEQPIVWNTVPVEHLLLLLCANAIVLVHEVQEWTLWLFQRCICARFQVSQIREYAFLKLLRVLDWSPKSLKAEGQAAHNVGTRDVKEIVPVSD